MKKICTILLVAIITFVSKPATYESPAERLLALNKKQEQSVDRLYRRWYSGPFHYMLTGGSRSSRVAGYWANSARSRSYIPYFIQNYAIDVDEIAQPIPSFKTFNEFFIRKLKSDARPLPYDRNTIISPADGSALVIENINDQTMFPTKTVSLSTKKMLHNGKFAKLFKGGTAIIIRLAPWDYHRFHFPTDGIASKPRIVAGRYESVSPTVYQAKIQPLEVNERHIIEYQSDKASTIAIILVGALAVGTIIETYTPDKQYAQGDEMGYFEFGGSTIVMLFQKDTISVIPELLRNSHVGQETPVKMGQVIGHVQRKK